jgi:acyl-coenzyme A synthetase/AMP-(fatty) acid ligase
VTGLPDSQDTLYNLASFAYRIHTNGGPVAFGRDGDVPWEAFCAGTLALRDDVERCPASEWVLCFKADSYGFAVACCAALAAGKSILLPGNLQPEATAALAAPTRGCLYDSDPPFPQHAVQWKQAPSGERAGTFDIGDLELPRITLLTSGTTGNPKSVRKSLGNLLTEVATLEAIWGKTLSNTRVVSTVSHQHIYGLLFRVLWPLFTGRAFDRSTLLLPKEVVDHAAPHHSLMASPAMLKRIGHCADEPYGMIFSSGGALSFPESTDCLNNLGRRPTEVFGSTETGGVGWREQATPDTPWTPFPKVQTKTNQDETLCVCTPYTTPPTWIETGDAVELQEDGRFKWLRRVDSIAKIEEKRVSLVEVKQRLVALDWVSEAEVLLLEPPAKIVLAAVLVLTPSGKAAFDRQGAGRFRIELRRQLRRHLEPAAVPRRYCEVEVLPINTQGKCLRSQLLSLFVKHNDIDAGKSEQE